MGFPEALLCFACTIINHNMIIIIKTRLIPIESQPKKDVVVVVVVGRLVVIVGQRNLT